ncbi:pyranose dehydrogenase [Coprinopsis marcescibilis]|uniref:pyranose dehydrogenase (acceptor) n=1 Tax=Coprinopsis marcescibilis TaxID=230819 RepID=A0A5C3KHN7_COPMA|nr:pyranose dehydrogenase [Coprinopsis marcescibilis]
MAPRLGWITILVSVTASLAYGKFYDQLDELPSDNENAFDFIVIGGGIGGSVVASRLSEDPAFNVLLIEAGPEYGVQKLSFPAYNGRINSTYNWNFVTEPQRGLNNRTFEYPRGHVLGGSSSLSDMIYTRGAADDYDRWAEVTGDQGWTWKELFPLIKRHERWVPPPGNRNVSGLYDPTVHGYSGNTRVSLPWGGNTQLDDLCLASANAQSDEFPFNIDQNSGFPIGLSDKAYMQSTIGNGERSSAASAYLDADIRKRPNLSIVVNTYTTRVLPVHEGARRLDIRSVEVAPRDGGSSMIDVHLTGKRRVITALKEVILAGGVFGSPQILLNSGIGDRTDLANVGIKVIHHLPDVGKEMHDHVFASTYWSARLQFPPPLSPEEAFKQWETNRTGPLTEAVGHTVLWSRIRSNASIFDEYPDPSSGPNSPHIETAIFAFPPRVGAGVVLLTPYSRGTIKLRSNNPFDAPLIDPNLFSHKFDVLAMKEGVMNTRRFFSGPIWDDHLLQSLSPNPDTVPDDEYEAHLRDTAGTFGHAVSTAAMSARNSGKGVVDPDLKVKGVQGLRVVDAAVIPFVPSAHSQASVYILAERAVELIKKSWTVVSVTSTG